MTKNWKTTLMGILAGSLMFVGGAMRDRAANPAAPPITAGNLLPSLAVMAIGSLAKDHDK